MEIKIRQSTSKLEKIFSIRIQTQHWYKTANAADMRILPECAPSAVTPPGKSSLRPWGSHPDCDSLYPAERPRVRWSYSGGSCGAPCALCCRLASANPVRYHCRMTTQYRHHRHPRGWPPPHLVGRSPTTPTTISSRGLDRGWTVGSGYRGHQGGSRMRTPWCYRPPRPTVVQLRGHNHRGDSCCLLHRRLHLWTCHHRTWQSSEPIAPFHHRCSIGVRDRVWGRSYAPSGPAPRARPTFPLSGLIRHCLLDLIRHCFGEIAQQLILFSCDRFSLFLFFPFFVLYCGPFIEESEDHVVIFLFFPWRFHAAQFLRVRLSLRQFSAAMSRRKFYNLR